MTTEVAECCYREDCIDVDTNKCRRCKNNRKRSYFNPVDYWPRPYDYTPWWWYPFTYPYAFTTTGDARDSTSWSSTTSHFVEAK